ncbi:MAG: DEAD/DEAH box helicase [Gammaproteobacteria bacterium]
MSFADLGLAPELLRAVSEKGYTEATPIQIQAIPVVLAGRDLLAGAQTGTGKTAAFVLPILQKLGVPVTERSPRALVLTPTRELAAQVAESARSYGKYAGLRTVVVFGGVGINPQIDALRSGCDVLVATPGRLLDLCEQRAVDLRAVQIFVLDEADRMLDMGFIHAIKRVIKMLPAQRQNLMFSATYSEDIRELSSRFLRNPATIEVAARNATADRVDQQVYRVPKDHKRHLLAHLIDKGGWHQVLVFARTKHGANRLAQQLEGAGIVSAAIHGNKSQAARVRALADFKANKVVALVATEVAARGLDIKELPHVVNYELPNVPEDYVHRIGRTARAGGTGSAVSLVSPDENSLLRDIERLLRKSIPVAALPEFEIKAGAPIPADTRVSTREGGQRFGRGGGGRSGGGGGRGDRRGRGGPGRGPSQGGHGRGSSHGGPGGGSGRGAGQSYGRSEGRGGSGPYSNEHSRAQSQGNGGPSAAPAAGAGQGFTPVNGNSRPGQSRGNGGGQGVGQGVGQGRGQYRGGGGRGNGGGGGARSGGRPGGPSRMA